MPYQSFEPDLDGTGLTIGVLYARFNEPICNALRDACLAELAALGVSEDDIVLASVPGALELPVALGQLGASGQFDALIALGAVVRGETYHFEVVSNESARGLAAVALEHDIPVANGVLTVENDDQGVVRAAEKGRDCARVAVEMANLAYRFDEAFGVSDADLEDEA